MRLAYALCDAISSHRLHRGFSVPQDARRPSSSRSQRPFIVHVPRSIVQDSFLFLLAQAPVVPSTNTSPPRPSQHVRPLRNRQLSAP